MIVLGTRIGIIWEIFGNFNWEGIFEIWNADDADLTDGRGFFFALWLNNSSLKRRWMVADFLEHGLRKL